MRRALREGAGEPRSGVGIILPLAAILIAALLGAAALLVAVAREQDRLQLLHERELVEFGLHTIEDVLTKSVKDYVNWDEAFLASGEPVDLDWLRTNLGGAHENLGFDYGIVLDAQGRTVLLLDRGRPLTGPVERVLGRGLDRLLTAARTSVGEQSEVAVGVLADAEGPVAAAAGVIVPQSEALRAERDPPGAVLLMARRIDDSLLEELGERLRVPELRLTTVDAEPGAADGSLAVVAADGGVIGMLRWRTVSPGARLTGPLVPLLAAIALVLTALIALALRNIRRATAELRAGEARFRDIATASSDWIFETDGEGRLTWLSDRFREVTGHDPVGLAGRPLAALLEPVAATDQPAPGLAARLAQPRAFRDLVCRMSRPGGSARLMRLAARPIVDRKDRLVGWRGTAADVTSESEAHSRAHYLAFHDVLTGLANRARFQGLLEEHLALIRGSGRTLAVLFLDLDRFKEINDSLGHAVGDHLLQLVAERIRRELRGGDLLARLGGDEFAVLAPDPADRVALEALGGRLVEALAEPFEIERQLVRTGTSVGIALAPDHGRSPEELLRHADIALYRAKAEGRGRVRLFAPHMAEEQLERQRLERDLRRAVERDELVLHYQPKAESGSGRVTSCEALLRWRHPARGMVAPALFVPLAEETGLIDEIGAWVVRTACRQAAAWDGISVAVNLSAAQFRDESLVATIRDALAESGLPPERLELEITESVLIDDTARAVAVLAGIKRLGVRIAMDDFGTGYSSLAYLQRFPFDKIKIDRSFIERVGERPDDAAIVGAIVQLARCLGMTTCAEGVERPAQLGALRRQGCEEVQGFLLGHPVPADEFARRFLADRRRADDGARGDETDRPRVDGLAAPA